MQAIIVIIGAALVGMGLSLLFSHTKDKVKETDNTSQTNPNPEDIPVVKDTKED